MQALRRSGKTNLAVLCSSALAVLAAVSLVLPLKAEELKESTEIQATQTLDPPVGAGKAAAGVVAGLTVGVPIKIGRDIKHEIRRMAGTLRGDCDNEFGAMDNAWVGGLSIPYGIASGVIMGGIRGCERAFTFGSRKPFSKESLGLVDPPKKPEFEDEKPTPIPMVVTPPAPPQPQEEPSGWYK